MKKNILFKQKAAFEVITAWFYNFALDGCAKHRGGKGKKRT